MSFDLSAFDPYKVAAAVLLVLWLLHWIVDAHYFLRLLLCNISSLVLKKRVHILDTTSFTSVCLTTDVDFLLFHMNNSRYMRELEFARSEFYTRTGLWQKIRKKGGLPVMGSSSIRYRRFIRTFSVYSVSSRIVYWDRESVYMEHRFVSRGDDFVCAIVHCRQRVIDCDVEELMGELLAEHAKKSLGDQEAPRLKPECPLEIHHWIQANLASSANLRDRDGN